MVHQVLFIRECFAAEVAIVKEVEAQACDTRKSKKAKKDSNQDTVVVNKNDYIYIEGIMSANEVEHDHL